MKRLKGILVIVFSKARKNLLAIDTFMFGLLFGYMLGDSRTLSGLKVDFSKVIQPIQTLCEWFLKFKPDPDFLSDIAAFEAAVIAFLIPLSIEIISKISERYESEITIRVFEERLSNWILPYMLMANIVLAILLRFSTNTSNEGTTLLTVLYWITLVFFVLVAFLILQVIRNIKKFMTNKSFIIRELLDDAKKSLK